jgi:hypothetical protein
VENRPAIKPLFSFFVPDVGLKQKVQRKPGDIYEVSFYRKLERFWGLQVKWRTLKF